jgi:O-antigen/teichoic acid export membrane protein
LAVVNYIKIDKYMAIESENNKRIAKNTVFLYLRMIFVLFLTLYISRVILDVLGVENFGIYNVVGGFVAMFAFLNTSMSNGVQRFFNVDIGANEGRNLREIYTASLYIQLALAGIILIITEVIGIWYINNIMVIPSTRLVAANWVFQFSILSFLSIIIQVPYVAAVMAYERMNFFAVVSVIDVVLRLAAVIMLKYISNIDALILYSFFIFLVSVADIAFYFIYTKNQFKAIKLTKVTDRRLFTQMVSFSGWNVFGSFAYMVKDQGLNMLLNVYFGPIVNAARAISYQVSNALNGFSTNIFTAFRPQLMQSYSSGDYRRTTILMLSMSKFTFFLMVLIAFPVIVEIKYILILWLGGNVPENTELFTVIVILNMLVTNFNPPVSQIVHATGKMKKYQIVTSLVLTSILPISWFFLQLGASADIVFWISLIVAVINQFICLIVLKGIFEYSIREYINGVIYPCLFVSVVVFPFTYGMHVLFEMGLFRLLIVTSVNLIVSVITIYMIGLTVNERFLILQTIKNRILKKL